MITLETDFDSILPQDKMYRLVQQCKDANGKTIYKNQKNTVLVPLMIAMHGDKINLCCANLVGEYVKFQCETLDELNALIVPVTMQELKVHYGHGFVKFLIKFVELWGEDMF